MVILGGGFGGLYAALRLKRAPVRVTLVDRHNHHLFQPLLYQVATATLSPSDIASPLRGLLGRHHISVLLAEATRVDIQAKRVILADGELAYDSLIVATGATHSYFGNDAWAKHAPGLKSIEDAVEIRRQVLLAFEMAEREPDPELRRQLLTFVIVGGGPTGVELAGALAEISRHALVRDFQNIDPSQARIILVEGTHHLLPTYPQALAERARQSLERLGVEVRAGVRVTQIDETGVFVGDEHIPARTKLWAAGVAASPLARSLGVALDRAGRVSVSPELTLPGRQDVFVIGDLAFIKKGEHPIPGVAPAAMQQGKHAANNILRQLQGQPMQPFRFNDRGTFSVIGRGSAVGLALARFPMSGYIAWLAWLFIHVLFLIGFRSKAAVLLNWAYSYVAFRRSARIITGAVPLLPRPPSRPGGSAGGPRVEGEQAPRAEAASPPGAS
ncbi:NADH dehydrogenase [Stigmatella aurantiaca DW4/3-1]|uniref:NADH:ubiquinone reductase (non-electrogenic) n=1 Tax=Stigmatella aurantiaca (strain DW4/3-1) TaxID=378806 RepID=E3FCC6_STIAD|nr:NADH dehydrogenase [Stigmatella aurantiaca DW4/3-1]